METAKKYSILSFLISAVLIVIVFAIQTFRVPEYRIQNLEPSEYINLNDDKLIENSNGIKESGHDTWIITQNEAVLDVNLDYIDSCGQVDVYIKELSCEEVKGYVELQGTSKTEFAISKGTNTIEISETNQNGKLKIYFINAENVEVNLDKMRFYASGTKENNLSGSVPLICCALICLLIYSMGIGNVGRKWMIRIVFLLSFLAIFLHMQNVYLYFDDFGYNALTYHDLLPEDTNRGLSDILKFLYNHYVRWGSRVLYFFFEIILIKNIFFMRLAEALLLTGIFYLCYRMASVNVNNESKMIAAVMPVICYMSLEKEIVADGAYWYSASIVFLCPIFFVLLALTLYHDICFKDRAIIFYNITKFKKVSLILFAFLASFSQEQISSAFLAMIVLLTVESLVKNRKLYKIQYGTLITALSGFMLHLFCPGSRIRISEVGGTVSIIRNVDTVLYILGADNQKYISGILLLCSAIVFVLIGKEHVKKHELLHRSINGILAALSGVILLIMMFYNIGVISAVQKILNFCHIQYTGDELHVAVFAVLSCTVIAFLYWYIWQRRQLYQAYIIIGAIAVLAVVCVSPSVPIRAVLPCYLLLIAVFTDIFSNAYNNAERFFTKTIISAFCVVIFGVAVMNFRYIFGGYQTNSYVEEENIARLEKYQEYVDENNCIPLYCHWDDSFGNIMPYTDGYSRIGDDMKTYYYIPKEYGITWLSYNEYIKDHLMKDKN